MKRAVRRALREWKEEFGRHWRRLNTFMRMIVGIVFSMLLIWAVRTRLLDPLQQQLTGIREANKIIDMPYGIIPPDHDPEVQENRLRAESLQQSLEQARRRVSETAAHMHVVAPARKGEVLNALDELITRHGLLLRNRREIQPDDNNTPIPVSMHTYALTGSFRKIHDFLRDLARFPHLSLFKDFELKVMMDENGYPRRLSGGAICLQLDFLCTLYYYNP